MDVCAVETGTYRRRSGLGLWARVLLLLLTMVLPAWGQAHSGASCEQRLRETTFAVKITDRLLEHQRDLLTQELRQTLERAERAEQALAASHRTKPAPPNDPPKE